jgi:hypothetical protein
MSTPIDSLTDAWNAGGTTFFGLRLSVTDTASAAASKIFQLNGGAAGSAELFSVDKSGNAAAAAAVQAGSVFRISTDTLLTRRGPANWSIGGADSATPVAQTLSVQGVTGVADTAAPNFTIDLPMGTGTGQGGYGIVRGSATGSGGLATVLTIYPNGGIWFGTLGKFGSPYIFPVTGGSTTLVNSGNGLCFFSYAVANNEGGFTFGGNPVVTTSGNYRNIYLQRTFAPTSGSSTYAHLEIRATINQTGGATGITRGLFIQPTLTAATDFRAIDITDGNIVLPKTITAAGNVGAQTIDKITGSVQFAIGATSLVVTNKYVTASSVISLTVASNDTTMKSAAYVAAAGSFTIYPNAAPTAECRVAFRLTN